MAGQPPNPNQGQQNNKIKFDVFGIQGGSIEIGGQVQLNSSTECSMPPVQLPLVPPNTDFSFRTAAIKGDSIKIPQGVSVNKGEAAILAANANAQAQAQGQGQGQRLGNQPQEVIRPQEHPPRNPRPPVQKHSVEQREQPHVPRPFHHDQNQVVPQMAPIMPMPMPMDDDSD